MRIGGALMRGASGGEIKRACIAAELVADPSMLFLDEPTTGLDSETALELMRIVKDYVCEKGIGVVCSIHQPSGELFHLFDYLYVIAKGRIVYNGVPKLAAQAFIDRGFSFDIKKLSQAEFVSSIALQISKNPEDKPHLPCVIATTHPDPLSTSEKRGQKPEAAFANSLWSNTCVLLRRRTLVTMRDKFQISSRLIKDVLSSVLIALVFWDTAHVGRRNITKRAMGLVITITIHALCSAFYIPSSKCPTVLFILSRQYLISGYRSREGPPDIYSRNQSWNVPTWRASSFRDPLRLTKHPLIGTGVDGNSLSQHSLAARAVCNSRFPRDHLYKHGLFHGCDSGSSDVRKLR